MHSIIKSESQTAQLFSWALNHIRMISEGSCDADDWSNDALQHRNKLHFKL